MKEVAAEHNVDVIDAGSDLDTHPLVYTDACHFDTQGHRMIANLLHTRLGEILVRRGLQPGINSP